MIQRNLEIWKGIQGYPDYQVSNMGRIRSLNRFIKCTNSTRFYQGRILKQQKDKDNYVTVFIYFGKIPKRRATHLLVLEHFGDPKPTPKHECNHKDGDKSNNWDINLEWLTHKENIKHAWKNGLCSKVVGEYNIHAKLTKKEVKEIRKLYATGKYSQHKLAKKFYVCQPNIFSIIHNTTWNFIVQRNPRVILRNTIDVELIQLTPDTARVLKKKLWLKAGGFCPILKQKVKVRDTVLDHKHKLKAQESGPHGRGLVRGCVFDAANGFEGMVVKKYKKQGLHNFIELPDLLENLAEYLRNPPCPQIYIYPSEKPRAPRLMKSDYNKIVKYYPLIFPRRNKIPPYPPGGIKVVGKDENKSFKYVAKLSDKWQKLLELIDTYIKEQNR